MRQTLAPAAILALLWACSLAPACLLDWDGPRPARPDLDLSAPPPADLGLGDRPLPDAPRDGGHPDSQADAFVLPGNWINISPGSFTMGSPTSEACRQFNMLDLAETPHEVTLTQAFAIMDNEVSEGQFEQVMGYNEAVPRSGSRWPYTNASWHEAAAYCDALSAVGYPRCYQAIWSGATCSQASDCAPTTVCINKRCLHYAEATAYAGKITTCPGFRLPTEAEWEYAYRAGTTSATYNGAIAAATCKSCSTSDLDTTVDLIAWYCANRLGSKSTPLDTLKQANAWQLYNMAGNVQEWCHDRAVDDLGTAARTDPVASPTASHVRAVVRGGSVYVPARWIRAAHRVKYQRDKRDYTIGLRCVRSLLGGPDAGPPDAGPSDAGPAPDVVDATGVDG